MTTHHDGPTVRHRLDLGRLVLGSLVEIGIKAYGASAAMGVALSDGETTLGKAGDGVAAVPTLSEEYHHTKYVIEHREQIQAALTYLRDHTPPQEELERSVAQSTETIGDIQRTKDELERAGEALGDGFPDVVEATDHLLDARGALPSGDSIDRLSQASEQAASLMNEVDVLLPVYYGGVLRVSDNLATDEIVSTCALMALSVVAAFLVGRSVGFWIRRGRPGLIAQLLQRAGVHVFPRWYARNLPYALNRPLYAAARAHVQREVVSDPETALDEHSFRELEEYFARRADEAAAPV